MPSTINKRRGIYVNNGNSGTLKHGIPVVAAAGIAGIAIKQTPRKWSDGFAVQNLIDVSEDYFAITHGEVEVKTGSGEAGNGVTWAVGDLAYVAAASTTSGVTTFAVNKTSAGGTLLGRVTETPTSSKGSSRVPANTIRVDLDLKV